MKDKAFLRDVWRVSAPIAAQNLLTAAVGYADVLMLACVSQTALGAVSLAQQVTWVLSLFYFGIAMGLTALGSQYWGKGEPGTIEKVLGLSLKLSLGISLLFALLAGFAPGALMRILTSDAELAACGAGYLRVIAVSYLPMGLSQMLLAVLKSVERTKESAAISTASLLVNIALNAVVVFILFPKDAFRASVGVAVTTTIARALECLLSYIAVRRRSLRANYRTPGWLVRDFWRCVRFVQMNYLVWGGATAAMSAVLGHIGAAAVSAWSIVGSVRNLASAAGHGAGSGGSILIGKALGAGKLEEARKGGDSLCLLALLIGAGQGLLILLLCPILTRLGGLDGEARELLRLGLLFSTIWSLGGAFCSITVGGIFCVGGDSRFGFFCDAITMWGIILPLSCLAAFALHLHTGWVLLIFSLDEMIKAPAAWAHYKKYKWIKNLTREEEKQ